MKPDQPIAGIRIRIAQPGCLPNGIRPGAAVVFIDDQGQALHGILVESRPDGGLLVLGPGGRTFLVDYVMTNG